MRNAIFGFFILLHAATSNAGGQGRPADHTATGIPIDTDWKIQVYDYAKKNVVHPSWGIAHSERDYQMAARLAKAEGIAMDLDVLFAAAFLHDLGGIGSFAKPNVDHAVRSAELAEPLLKSWRFPMEKWPQVRDMILGHTYYGPAPNNPRSLAFRDADILDFLGNIGIARILAVTEEPGRSKTSLGPSIEVLQEFRKNFPGKLSLKTARSWAEPRLKELDKFLKLLDAECLGGKAL